MLICIRQLCDFTVGGSWAPWEEPGLPHPPWLAAWKGLQQPLHCRQKGGGAGVCTLEREKHGAWGGWGAWPGPGTLLLHEQHHERARCARNHRSCRWVRGGITPKPLCFCNTKVETEHQWRGRPARPFLPVLQPRLFSNSSAALQGMGFAIVLCGSWAPLKIQLFQAKLASAIGRLTAELRHVGGMVFF